MPTFYELTTPRRLANGHFVHDIPDGWQQGRGAFGGLVLATLARAAEAFAGKSDQTLRTLTGELCGPVQPGRADIHVEALRMGSGTSTLAARLVQAGEVQTHAVIVLGRARHPEPRYDGLAVPVMPPWRERAVVAGDQLAPSFARFFEYRDTATSMSNGKNPQPIREAHASGWVRPLEAGAVRDAAYIVGVADAWWPALLSTMSAPRPMATLTFTVDVVGSCEGLDPSAPLYHDARTLVVRDGWAPELRTLWGEDGRLLAINHQTFVIIK